jgi:hypothetical protein
MNEQPTDMAEKQIIQDHTHPKKNFAALLLDRLQLLEIGASLGLNFDQRWTLDEVVGSLWRCLDGIVASVRNITLGGGGHVLMVLR